MVTTYRRNGEVLPKSELGIRNFTKAELKMMRDYLKKNPLKVYINKDSVIPDKRRNSKKIKIIEL